MSIDYNPSQPLQLTAIKIGNYELTEAELNRFVKLNSYRIIPSEYIGDDVKVNVYTLTEYAMLDWVPHPSTGDIAIVFNSDPAKRYHNGSYVYQAPAVGDSCPNVPGGSVDPSGNGVECCIQQGHQHTLSGNGGTQCPSSIQYWKLLNCQITQDDIAKWDKYAEEIGVIRKDITDLGNHVDEIEEQLTALVEMKESALTQLMDAKIANVKSEITTAYTTEDNKIRNDFAVEDQKIKDQFNNSLANVQGQLDNLKEKEQADYNELDQRVTANKTAITNLTNKQAEDVENITKQHTNDVEDLTRKYDEKIRIVARDISDLDHKFDVTITAVNTSVDQKLRLQNEELTSKLNQHQSIVDGKLEGQDIKLTTAIGKLTESIDSVRTFSINENDELADTLNSSISKLKNMTDANLESAKGDINVRLNTLDQKFNNADLRVTSEVDTINSTINTKVGSLKTYTDVKVGELNTRIDNEVTSLNSTISSEVTALKSELNTNVSNLNNTITANDSNVRLLINQQVNTINHNFDLHKNDNDIHVTAAKQAVWNAKVSTEQLETGLSVKANVVDVYDKAMIDGKFKEVNSLIEIKAKQYFQGFFATTAELPLPGQQGWYAIVGTTDTIWVWDVEGKAWIDSKATSAVTSVNGQSGIVMLDKEDIGLANVDNTADADKPISTAAQTALSKKVDKVDGKGLSTNDYDNAAVVEVGKVVSKADKTYVDTELALKADKEYVDQLPSTVYFKGVVQTKAELPVAGINPGQYIVCMEDDLVYVWDQETRTWLSPLDKVYTKGESDLKLSSKVDKVNGKGLSTNDYDNDAVAEVAKVTNKADKNYVDDKLALKANTDTVNTALDGKANVGDSYLKSESDSKYADAIDTTTKLSTKANVTDVNNNLALKADKTYVDQLPSTVYFKGVFDNEAALPKTSNKPGEYAITLEEDRVWIWDGESSKWVSNYSKSELDAKFGNKLDVSVASEAFDKKVDKVAGKGLSTNDYDNVAVAEVAKVATKADQTAVDAINTSITNITTNLNKKADQTYVEEQLKTVTKSRGYYKTTAEIMGIPNPTNGDYAVNAETNTVWFFTKGEGNDGTWIDSDVKGQVTTAELEQALALKADNATVSTKADEASVVTRLDSKVDKVAGKGLSTNDYNDLAVAEVAKVTNKADKAYVDTELAKKADKTDVTSSLALKADKSYVDTTLAEKAGKNYVDIELAKKSDLTYVNSTFVTKTELGTSTDSANVNGTIYARIASNTEKVATKADKSYVDSTFATVSSVDNKLSTKANTSDVTALTASLNQKANTTDLNNVVSQLDTKVDKSVVGTSSDSANATGSLFARIAALEARIAVLEAKP